MCTNLLMLSVLNLTPILFLLPLSTSQGTLRYLGMVTIILNDFPILKYVLIGIMGLFVLTNKES